jgi:hypothetical protein
LISVILDAGAGDAWKYSEGGQTYSRTEGLAVASVAMFRGGAFSNSGAADPHRADGDRLARITSSEIAHGFQVTDSNPLAGLEGRSQLLSKLAQSMAAWPQIFGATNPRPGNMVDALARQGNGAPVKAKEILNMLLLGLSRMWPARSTVDGMGFGDVWPYPTPGGTVLIPFHKLSQWLTYSLVEPIESAGIRVTGIEELTGLPEYRNGGLFLDTGVLKLRDPRLAQRELEASEPAIIQWRALTVQLLDLLWVEVLKRKNVKASEVPLARVLQGGTWSAGREIAKRLRPGGPPPLRLKSDGSVF